MFNRLSFKTQPETFRLTLGYAEADAHQTEKAIHDGVLTTDSIAVEWTSSETEDEVLSKIFAAATDVSVQKERVAVQLSPEGGGQGFWGVVSAASTLNDVQLAINIQTTKPPLRSIEVLRASTGTITTSLGLGIWSSLDVSHVTRLRCNEGITSLWDRSLLEKFSSLRVLNLSHANVSALPGVIGTLTCLQELRLTGNNLKILPVEIGKLQNLRVLAIDSNEISILPGELRKCTALEEFTLENNRLTSVLLSFGSLRRLRILHLSGNPLEFLPEISPCEELRSLTVANLRVHADKNYDKFHVELLTPVAPSASININLFDSKPNDKLRPIFSLMLRRSSGHHPLLAGAFRHLAEDPKNRDLMSRQENALQQLILMALNDDSIVVDQTCKTLRLLAQHSPALAAAILDTDAGSLKGLLKSTDPVKQLASLNAMAGISLSLGDAPNRLLSPDVVDLMLGIVNDASTSHELRAAALVSLGNLAFSKTGKAQLSSNPRVMDTILRRAQGGTSAAVSVKDFVPVRVKAAAVRALAIFGDVLGVSRAVGRPIPPGRGLRILSMDGGGMKGMATVRLLRQLELHTGRPIHSLFDLIVGTSTGGLLTVALGLRKLSLDECEHIYKVLGQQVFSKPSVTKEKDETWMETFYRTFHSRTQHVRAVVVGYKHDATVYEKLLKDYCSFAQDPRCPSDTLIDTAALDVPKVALVSTLASSAPATPFVFRNYELPADALLTRQKMGYHKGSSKHAVWQAVRASSAAIYYLDDFSCGGQKFQDGAVVANNPSIIALQEARALWPDNPIDVFVSVGTGSTPHTHRDSREGISAYVDTGNILIESATNVERAHEALATMTPLIPSLQYFRFEPTDERCRMELDEVDPLKWAILEEATDSFIEQNRAEFAAAAEALVGGPAVAAAAAASAGGGGGIGGGGTLMSRRASSSALLSSSTSPSALPPLSSSRAQSVQLGLHRGLFVCTATPPASEASVAEVAAAACARLKNCSGAIDLQSWRPTTTTTTVKNNRQQPAASPIVSTTTTTPIQPAIANSAQPVHASKNNSDAVASSSTTTTTTTITTTAADGQTATATAPHVVEVDLGSAIGSVLSWFSPSAPSKQMAAATTATTTQFSSPPFPSSPTPPGSTSRSVASTPPSSLQRHLPSPTSHPLVLNPTTAATATATMRSESLRVADGHHLEQQSQGDEGINYAQLLKESIASTLPAVGIHIFALRSCSTGLVLRWADSFAAVTVPSDEADDIVLRAGVDPRTTTLSVLFDQDGGEITLHGNVIVRAVSKQYRRSFAGERESIILVQYTTPVAVLDEEMIRNMMGSSLSGKIVICADIVPPSCVSAFHAAGVLAVVAPTQPLGATAADFSCSANALASFWADFVSKMQNGSDLIAALQETEEAHPALDGAFSVQSPPVCV